MKNWKSFFFRLTVVASIAVFIIIIILYEKPPRQHWWENTYDAEPFVFGLFGVICVWGLYFGIRWIYAGLKK